MRDPVLLESGIPIMEIMMPRTVLALLALTLVAACAPAIQQHAGVGDRSTVRIDVTNDHWSDVEVFLVLGDDRRRLGTVQGGASNHFFFPGRLLSAGNEALVRMESTDMAGAWTSDPVRAPWGKAIGFRVAPDVGASVRLW